MVYPLAYLLRFPFLPRASVDLFGNITQFTRGEFKKTLEHPASTLEQVAATTGANILLHSFQIGLGMSPYMYMANLGKKAEQATHVLQMYNMKTFAKLQYYLDLDKLASKWFLGSHLPTKVQAKAAAKTISKVGRAVPIIGAIALAHDLYDIVFNRSFWGFKFGNPTPFEWWWE
jgi:hypothetical protein